MSNPKAIILLTVFIDVIGLGIVIPILPFYVAQFSNSALLITSLFAVFALCSFLSAPIIGALSDRVGRRPMLIASIFSTSLGWFVFALAPSILFLFIGRIIDGVMAGNFPIAQSYLSDVAKDDKERSANFGLIGAVFGIAFILGPFLGGVLGHFGHNIPFLFVGFLALFNGILALFILPETHHLRSTKAISINPFTPLVAAFGNYRLRGNYIAWFLFGLAVAGYQAIFSLYLRDVFSFNELVGGIIYGIIGIIIAVNQGLAMKHLWLKYFKEANLELFTLLVFAFGFLLLGIPTTIFFCLAIVLTTFGQSILRVVMTSQVVSQSLPHERGEVLGVMSSVTSLSMMIGPFLSGFMYQKHPSLPFIFGSLCILLAFLVIYTQRRRLNKLELAEDVEMESMV